MSSTDFESRLRPWLQRWSVDDVSAERDWFANMDLRSWQEGDCLVREGDVDDTLFLVDAGLVRLFYSTPEGKERNKAFFRAGDVTGPVSAAMTGSAAPFTIQCLEPTTAITFHYRDLAAAVERSDQVARLYRELLSEAFIRNEQREAMLLTCNAEQRYRWLLEHEPDLVERLPQFHIASYLGVDAVSLSRIKRKLR